MAIVVLAAICAVALVLVPLGLPGLWIMVAAGIGYDMLVPQAQIGWTAIAIATGLGVIAEYLEFSLGSRYARRYGGSRRAGWGALVGGLVGAIVGVPVPVLGPIIGAFAGAFCGALVAEYTNRTATAGTATRVATGALIGRLLAAAIKNGIATVVAVLLVFTAWR